MPSIQSLKKQLRGVLSTQKLTKAMKTVSAAKFSRLNGAYGKYAEYGRQCKAVFDRFQEGFLDAVPAGDSAAPPLYVVLTANKGLCGSFNTEVLKFAQEEFDRQKDYVLLACGKKAVRFFTGRGVPLAGEYVLHDEPSYEQSCQVLDELLRLRMTGRACGVYVIYPKYVNMLTQTPAMCELFPPAGQGRDAPDDGAILCEPDRDTFIARNAREVFRAIFYELVLETALGAQAATLMTMRVAYDAATEYSAQLEGQISRKRQSAVTADVIETSSGGWDAT